jgi:hypothetical protein
VVKEIGTDSDSTQVVFGFSFYTSGKGNINFLKYRQSVFNEDVLIKLKFSPA